MLVGGAPQIMLLAGDPEHYPIQMPLVAGPGQPAPHEVGELLAKLQALLADRFVDNFDAPEHEHLLHDPKAQGKAKVKLDCVVDQLRRKAVVRVTGLG
jgi:hypothetical protein